MNEMVAAAEKRWIHEKLQFLTQLDLEQTTFLLTCQKL